MEQDLITTLQAQYKVLPHKVRKYLTDAPIKSTVERIAASYSLSEDQSQSLAATITTVLYGFIDPIELVSSLKQNVGLTQEVADEIAQELNDYLLEPVLPDLIQYQVVLDDYERSLNTAATPINKTEQSYADEKEEDEITLASIVSKEDVLSAIENPVPSEVKKVAPAVSTAQVSAQAAELSPKNNENALPFIKIMPHTTQELADEQNKEMAVQKQVSTSFIEKKLTQPQKTGTTVIQKINPVTTPTPTSQKPAPTNPSVDVPRYTNTDPYRESI